MALTARLPDPDIWIYDIERGALRRITFATGEDEVPVWSPDGKRLAYSSNSRQQAFVTAIDGSGQEESLLKNESHFHLQSWSPDGKLIAFDSQARGESNIYVVDPHSGVPQLLPIDIHNNNVPRWSHDGKWIYFENGVDSDNPGIWKVPSSGGHALQIAKRAERPIESPDGQRVFFIRDEMLWTVKSDGTGEEQVAGMPHVWSDRWTPYGSGIYFVKYNDEKSICFFDLSSRETRTVFNMGKYPPNQMGNLAVSSDGKRLLFAQRDEATSELMMIENWR